MLIDVWSVPETVQYINELKYYTCWWCCFLKRMRNFLEHSYASYLVEYQLRAVVLLVCKCTGWARHLKYCAMKLKLVCFIPLTLNSFFFFLESWTVKCFPYSELYLGLCVFLVFVIWYTMYILKKIIPYANIWCTLASSEG